MAVSFRGFGKWNSLAFIVAIGAMALSAYAGAIVTVQQGDKLYLDN